MIKSSKIFFTFLLIAGICTIASADRGGFVKKDKSRLNIASAGTLRNSIRFDLKSDVKYKGSFLLNQQQIGNSIVSDAIVSYKKGNTIYLIPYKHKVLIPDYSQNEGYKLIIRSRK